MSTDRFIPEQPSDFEGLDMVAELMARGRCAVLTGAGCSTASGIPDYRGPETGKKERRPIMYQEFVKYRAARQRYWARSALGWPRICQARPNRAHEVLAQLEASGVVSAVITQNVDGLHQRAGSRQVVDLHGRLAEVVCLDCGDISCRDALQARIGELNRHWPPETSGELAPDGDMEVRPALPEEFQVPACRQCGGILKPRVVFFGENVAAEVVEKAWELVFDADLLLVLGSSLTVYSGYRFVRGAGKAEIPVGIINIGPTRGDELATVKVEARVGEALAWLKG